MKLSLKLSVSCSCHFQGKFCVNSPSAPEITIEANTLKSRMLLEVKKQFRKGFRAACSAIWGGMNSFSKQSLSEPLGKPPRFLLSRLGVWEQGGVLKSLPALVYSFSLTWCSNSTSQRNFINSKAANNKVIVL